MFQMGTEQQQRGACRNSCVFVFDRTHSIDCHDFRYPFPVALTMPSSVLSNIQVESYKKYVLVCLIVHGESVALPQSTSHVVFRNVERLCQPYMQLARAYKKVLFHVVVYCLPLFAQSSSSVGWFMHIFWCLGCERGAGGDWRGNCRHHHIARVEEGSFAHTIAFVATLLYLVCTFYRHDVVHTVVGKFMCVSHPRSSRQFRFSPKTKISGW